MCVWCPGCVLHDALDIYIYLYMTNKLFYCASVPQLISQQIHARTSACTVVQYIRTLSGERVCYFIDGSSWSEMYSFWDSFEHYMCYIICKTLSVVVYMRRTSRKLWRQMKKTCICLWRPIYIVEHLPTTTAHCILYVIISRVQRQWTSLLNLCSINRFRACEQHSVEIIKHL